MNHIIVRPIITEKTLRQAEELNQYTFEVGVKVNKIEIAKEVESKFDVKVEKVRVINNIGKKVSFGKRRITGKKQDVRKAVVTLKSGNKIGLFNLK